MTGDKIHSDPEVDSKQPQTTAITEYHAKLQHWMWQYWGYVNWQSWLSQSAFQYKPPCTSPLTPGEPASVPGGGQQVLDVRSRDSHPYPFGSPASSPPVSAGGSDRTDARPTQQQNRNPAGREYTIPSPLLRFLAEAVDHFILFCVKVSIVLWIMHLIRMKDISKFFTHFILVKMDENTSLEDLKKMIAVALVFRVLACFYETICIWGSDGATPGKFLLGLQVVTCNTCTLVRSNRVLVVPGSSHVSLYASIVRTVNKNISIHLLFPVFILFLFFKHNRTEYDIVAGTIVVQRRGAR